MKKQQDRPTEKKIKHANFSMDMETYSKFRILAATKGISLMTLYSNACKEYLERHPVSIPELR